MKFVTFICELLAKLMALIAIFVMAASASVVFGAIVGVFKYIKYTASLARAHLNVFVKIWYSIWRGIDASITVLAASLIGVLLYSPMLLGVSIVSVNALSIAVIASLFVLLTVATYEFQTVRKVVYKFS